jgi:hypothetical protein
MACRPVDRSVSERKAIGSEHELQYGEYILNYAFPVVPCRLSCQHFHDRTPPAHRWLLVSKSEHPLHFNTEVKGTVAPKLLLRQNSGLQSYDAYLSPQAAGERGL